MTKKRAAGMENTLDAEGTIRIHYLRDKIRGWYYTNRHIRQEVSLDGIRRAEMSHASPGATLKIMAYSRYLFMEIWQSGILEDPIEETLKKRGLQDFSQLGGLIEQDPDTKKLVETMRHRFSTHRSFTLEDAIAIMRPIGFERFWMSTQRILMFKDALSVVGYEPGSLDDIIESAGDFSAFPTRFLTRKEKLGLRRRYESPVYDVAWGTGNSMEILQECVAGLRTLMEEHMVSAALHRCYNTRETLERLVSSTYNLKYIILEAYEFIRTYETLKIPHTDEMPTEPKLFAREDKYEHYRNKYSAHSEDGVPSIMYVIGDASFMGELFRDAEEILVLSRRLLPDFDPRARLELPTLERIGKMDGEMERLRLQSHAQLGNRFLDSEYERKCDELRAAVTTAYGLN